MYLENAVRLKYMLIYIVIFFISWLVISEYPRTIYIRGLELLQKPRKGISRYIFGLIKFLYVWILLGILVIAILSMITSAALFISELLFSG